MGDFNQARQTELTALTCIADIQPPRQKDRSSLSLRLRLWDVRGTLHRRNQFEAIATRNHRSSFLRDSGRHSLIKPFLDDGLTALGRIFHTTII